MRLLRAVLGIALTPLAGVVGTIVNPTVSSATSGETVVCTSAGYNCAGGGYNAKTAATSGWPWTYYGPPWAGSATNPHNCTLYAAYRLEKNGLKVYPGWQDNAGLWHTHLSS
ncbi:MAG: hypothetical protein ACREP9_11195, partial [Candidatus Dormibacteraceae bacterium]